MKVVLPFADLYQWAEGGRFTDDHGREMDQGAIFDTFFVVFILFLFSGVHSVFKVTFFLLWTFFPLLICSCSMIVC
jgi:hypothetical protein